VSRLSSFLLIRYLIQLTTQGKEREEEDKELLEVKRRRQRQRMGGSGI
jgi:hypothetical protein